MHLFDLTTCFPGGNIALPLSTPALTLLIQEGVGYQRECPALQDDGGLHQLILVQTQYLLPTSSQR